MRNVLSQIWKLQNGLQIREVGDKFFMFLFGDVKDKDRIHGLSLGLMTQKIGVVLEELTGDVLEVDMADNRLAWGRFLRIHILLNITKSLPRCSSLMIEGQGHVVVSISI
ncbi:hypothetical protein REPUB_Repub13aG0019800 [Reevesia pubescens]